MHKSNRTGSAVAGVALITVLAVLTILGLLAAAFAIFTTTDTMTSRTSVARVTADMMCAAGLNHALSALWADSMEQPAWDDPQENWRQTFMPVSHLADDATDIDGIAGLSPNEAKEDGRWVYVTSANGKIVGRYAVQLDDECSKVNINAAAAIGEHGQNMGVGPFELLLSDGRGRGLPLSLAYCINALKYRYGRDLAPGKRGADDNLTESTYGNDEIDNDADGVVDELGEGIDEPEEYSSVRPVWDDRVFSSVDELLDKCDTGGRVTSTTGRRMLRRYATIYGRSREMFYDERARAWRRQVNLNVASRDQIRRVMNRANADTRFENSSRNMSILVANVMDYRDENNVLTTAGGEYGVEAVCFNEIMANDGGYVHETDWQGWNSESDWDAESFVPCYNYFYNNRARLNRFRVRTLSHSGDNADISLTTPQRTTKFMNEFLACDSSWTANFWNGARAVLYLGTVMGATGNFKVVSSAAGSGRRFSVVADNQVARNFLTNNFANLSDITVEIGNSWQHGPAWWCTQPEQSEEWFFPLPQNRRHFYYRVYVASMCFNPADGWFGNAGNLKTELKKMDMDGDSGVYSETDEEQLKYVLQDGKAQRANGAGYIGVMCTSARTCRANSQYYSFNNSVIFRRPDIVELINISERAISLCNWKVVVNTGRDANVLSTIDTVLRFSARTSGAYYDPNPRIEANGYFYITNNREIFDIDHASGDGNYGGNRQESIPVYELPEKSWGIQYNITSVKGRDVTVEGASWRPDQLKGELVEYISDRTLAKQNSPNGEVKTVESSRRTSLTVTGDAEGYGLRAGDQLLVLGLPRQGGFVSFTLKNEYGQVTARTTEYGSLDENEYSSSSEKYDPTHYTWVKSNRPTISGNPRDARNHTMPTGSYVPAHVKDNRFVSVGELQNVRKAADWENIGMDGRGKPTTRTLQAIAKYFTVSGIRLDPEEQGAHISGWKPAFGAAQTRGIGNTFGTSCAWEPGIWGGQTLRIMSGPLNGERYYITNSTQSGLTIAGYSAQHEKLLQVVPGDRFSVGPGYSTPMFYCRQNGEAGIWEWQNKDLEPMSYGLYLSGLSDSINTTEFLEENHNAELRIEVFNFQTEAFEQVPLARDDYTTAAADDVYQMVRSRTRLQYDKTDNVYCGMIHPEHISANGGIRLRITPSSLNDKMGSGFAWFDYAVLTPGSAFGKININTASERILGAINGVTPAVAANIAQGMDRVGRPALKPYKNITDVLDVRGVTPAMFTVMANLITTRSDQFRVQVVAQALDCSAPDGIYDPQRGDRVIAQTHNDVVVDRGQLTDDNPANNGFVFLPSK